MIRLENVTRKYGNLTAVDNLSMEVGDGELCVLIGPSGCGKTTTLRMINRLIEPNAGTIYIYGKDTRRVRPEALRRGIGYAIQSVGLFPHMTVAQNIAVVPALLHWDRTRRAARVQELLTLVGLKPEEAAGKYPNQLSGGEAQRIGVARALAADPPILLMDEPFGAVDPLTRERLQAEFLRIQREVKKTIILVTHDLDEAIRLADRIAIMSQGQLMQYDTPEAILAHPANKFVRDFAGTDRALKRLSRINVSDYVREAPSVTADASLATVRAALGQRASVWVVTPDGGFVGWIDRDGLEQASNTAEAVMQEAADTVAITTGATLREALSRMLGQGIRSTPVLDADGRFVGEVNLGDVEAATQEPGEI
jgi:osmoprotectant transport system ATP-binding protein